MKSLLLFRLVKRKGRGFTATLVRYRRVEIRELAQRLSDTSHMLRESMALAMLTVFPQVLKEELMKNNSVHIDGLGTFSLHMQSETVDSPHEFRMKAHVKGFEIRFRADQKLLPKPVDDVQLKKTD